MTHLSQVYSIKVVLTNNNKSVQYYHDTCT